MTYGLECWNSAGTKTLSLTDTISRLRYNTTAANNTNGSIVLSDISGKSTCQFAIALENGKLSHLVNRSGTTISWTYQDASGYNGWESSDSLILVFLYD